MAEVHRAPANRLRFYKGERLLGRAFELGFSPFPKPLFCFSSDVYTLCPWSTTQDAWQSLTQSSFFFQLFLPPESSCFAHTKHSFYHQPPTRGYIFRCNFLQIIPLSPKQSSRLEFTPLFPPLLPGSLSA